MTLQEFFQDQFDQGATREEIAQRVGLSAAEVSYISAGWKNPEPPTLRKFATAFGWTLAELGTVVLSLPDAPTPRYVYGKPDRPGGVTVQRHTRVDLEAAQTGSRNLVGVADRTDEAREGPRPSAPEDSRSVLRVDAGRDRSDDDVRGSIEEEAAP